MELDLCKSSFFYENSFETNNKLILSVTDSKIKKIERTNSCTNLRKIFHFEVKASVIRGLSQTRLLFQKQKLLKLHRNLKFMLRSMVLIPIGPIFQRSKSKLNSISSLDLD